MNDTITRGRVIPARVLGLVAVLLGQFMLAPDALVLIGARFVQGIGAAAASSVILAIIATEFPRPEDRAKAMSGYMFVSVSGGSLGLFVGGLLTQFLGWRWIFWINVPVGLVALALVRRHLPSDA